MKKLPKQVWKIGVMHTTIVALIFDIFSGCTYPDLESTHVLPLPVITLNRVFETYPKGLSSNSSFWFQEQEVLSTHIIPPDSDERLNHYTVSRTDYIIIKKCRQAGFEFALAGLLLPQVLISCSNIS